MAAVNRIVPTYIQHMWMATADQGLAATLYGPCTVSALAGEKVPVKLTCRTAYPFEETIRVTVEPSRPASFPLSFRVPSWCRSARIAVNAANWDATPDKNGFVRIVRQWNRGDVVSLNFPMSVRIERGFETEYPECNQWYYWTFKPNEVFEKRRLPYESVHYGPLLFALPIPDKDPNTPLSGARWQYALNNDGQRGGVDARGRAEKHAGHLGLAARRAHCLKSAGQDFRLAADGRKPPASRTRRRRQGRDDSAGSLRLHEVPDLHVSGDPKGLAAGTAYGGR